MKKITRTLLALLLAAVCMMLCACAAEPEPEPTEDPNLLVLDYTLVAENAADLQVLENYVNLQTLDLRGSGTLGWSVAHRQLCRARLGEGDQAYGCLQYLIKDR